MTKQIVLVDMDGVLADFTGATNTFIQETFPATPIAPARSFYLERDYDDRTVQAAIRDFHATQHFFRNLPVIDGALKGWQKIIDLGYEPRICSSPLMRNQWCEVEKLDWLEEHLGKHVRETAIITKHKEQADGIALIDDRPEIKHAEKATWQHVVFHQPYNQHVDTPLRLRDWHDENLATVLEQAAHMSKQS